MDRLRGYLSRFVESLKVAYKTPAFWLKFAAYAIPLAFLLYVLYWNFLPFGYNKTFVIKVGSPGDTSGEFYLEPSRNLSEPKTAADGSTYRELNGVAYAVFKPKAVLKNAQITVSVEGDGVSIISPQISLNPDSVKWDHSWDFTQAIPKNFSGNAFHFDDRLYFDGKSKLELSDSSSQFENGPFSLYVEWKPENNNDNFQEIAGHYNWELLQNKDSISFQVGRVNDAQGNFYLIQYPINSSFFNKKHSALAIYSPASQNGYIDLFVDGNYAGRTYLNQDVIWADYGSQNFSLGKSNHGGSNYFRGSVFLVNMIQASLTNGAATEISFEGEGVTAISIPINAAATSSVREIKIHVER